MWSNFSQARTLYGNVGTKLRFWALVLSVRYHKKTESHTLFVWCNNTQYNDKWHNCTVPFRVPVIRIVLMIQYRYIMQRYGDTALLLHISKIWHDNVVSNFDYQHAVSQNAVQWHTCNVSEPFIINVMMVPYRWLIKWYSGIILFSTDRKDGTVTLLVIKN